MSGGALALRKCEEAEGNTVRGLSLWGKLRITHKADQKKEEEEKEDEEGRDNY